MHGQRESSRWSVKNEQQEGEESQKVGSGAHLGGTKGQVGVLIVMEMGIAGEIQGEEPMEPLQGETGT